MAATETTRARVGIVCDEPLLAALLPVPVRTLKSLLAALLDAAGELAARGTVPSVPASVRLALVTDAEMAVLNREAMGCPGPTNVLSFPGETEEDGADLALGVETLLRESLLYGQDPRDHLVRLLAHGMSHVCGLDHGPEMDGCQRHLEEAVAEALS